MTINTLKVGRAINPHDPLGFGQFQEEQNSFVPAQVARIRMPHLLYGSFQPAASAEYFPAPFVDYFPSAYGFEYYAYRHTFLLRCVLAINTTSSNARNVVIDLYTNNAKVQTTTLTIQPNAKISNIPFLVWSMPPTSRSHYVLTLNGFQAESNAFSFMFDYQIDNEFLLYTKKQLTSMKSKLKKEHNKMIKKMEKLENSID